MVKRALVFIILLSLCCLFVINIISFSYENYQDNVVSPNLSDSSAPALPLRAAEVDPYYALRIPSAYNISGQSGIITYGDLSTLAFENTTLQFRRDYTDISTGTTYVIFTISTAGVTLDPDFTLTLNLEADGSCTAILATSSSQITIYILYMATTWVPIHVLTSTTDMIHRVNGWFEYTVPLPFSDYLVGTDLQVKVELTQQLIAPQAWTQRLNLRWLLLELRKDVGLNVIAPTRVTLLTPGFTIIGNMSCFSAEDGTYYRFERVLPAGGETGRLQFLLEYNLGYYGINPLLGLRFTHDDWLHVVGIVNSLMATGRIYLNKINGNAFLCLTRIELDNPATPDIRYACMPMVGDWRLNNYIRFLFSVDYTVSSSSAATIQFLVDWAHLQIVRPPNPIILADLLNTTIYAGQTVWLNLTCLNGKAPITEIYIQPWNQLVGTTAGSFLYSHVTDAGGQLPLSLNIKDAESDQYSQPLGTLNILYRPIAIALYLSENPYSQELIIQLSIRDILSNTPLPLYTFTKTILKDGAWFRQQVHQTTTSGTFTIHEPVLDYLDYNYTVIIETAQTTRYEATSVRASLILSQCPPQLTIHAVNYSRPLRANDLIWVNYTATCLTVLDELWLCRNGSLLFPLNPALGLHNFTFHDIGGAWEYRLYANNSRKFQAYSSPFKVQILPLKTTLQLESTVDVPSHTIALEIRLYDECNRSCVNVPLQITIYDGGQVFYDQVVPTGMDGAALILHFDQYLDHAFTIQIASEATPLYRGALLTAGDLAYHGYPLYWVVGLVGILAGISVTFHLIKRRLEL